MLEHKGLYWSKIKGTEDARTIEPDEHYILPFGKARIVQEADYEEIGKGKTLTIITYGMGVYWAKKRSTSISMHAKEIRHLCFCTFLIRSTLHYRTKVGLREIIIRSSTF